MRHAKSDYTSTLPGPLGVGLEAYVPFVGRDIAEPPLGDVAIPMLQALPEVIAAKYADINQLVRPRESVKDELKLLNKRFCKVLGERSEYVSYFQRREVWSMWELVDASDAIATASIAAVPKRDSHLLRKILMI